MILAEEEKTQLVEGILLAADRLFRQLLPTIPRELIALDVTMPQFKIMLILYIYGPSRMSAIATELGVTLPTATSLVDRLVEREYVLRDNSVQDRRVVLCRLSPAGQKGIDRIWEAARATSRQLLEGMDTAILRNFNEVLADMAKAAARAPGETVPDVMIAPDNP